MAILIGDEFASSKSRTQVYKATHIGEDYLPYMHRSFISFSFGGRNIEDFNLIAYTDGDRISRDGSSNFNNLTTSSDVLNGQLYWGTFFEGNSLSLNLATDGITQRELDDFLRWFRAGETRELILAEHPNRGILARLAEPPHLSLLPFEKSTSLTLRYRNFTTSTTLYRGEIEITFQMDEPFWYSINNIFGEYVDGEYKDTWIDANKKVINVFDASVNQDAVKIMLEDGIPFSSMIQSNMLLGDNTVAITGQDGGAIIANNSFVIKCTRYEGGGPEDFDASYYIATLTVKDESNNYIWLLRDTPTYTLRFDETLASLDNHISSFDKVFNTASITDEAQKIANIKSQVNAGMNNEGIYTSERWDDIRDNTIVSDTNRIQGVIMSSGDGIPELAANVKTYNFYYAGTAPSYPTLEFTLEPSLNSSNYYIMIPSNTFAQPENLPSNRYYNTITIESQNKYEFKFTTPNIYTSYNTAIQIFTDNVGKRIEQIVDLIRENVKHYKVRAWAIRILDYMVYKKITTFTLSSEAGDPRKLMSYLFFDIKYTDGEPSGVGDIIPSTYRFDSKTGIANGTFKIRNLTTAVRSGSVNSIYPANGAAWATYCSTKKSGNNLVKNGIKTLTENIGDMIKSDWLVIKERNYPDENNLIRSWTDAFAEGKSYSHRIYHDVENGLQNIKLEYRNMYL